MKAKLLHIFRSGRFSCSCCHLFPVTQPDRNSAPAAAGTATKLVLLFTGIALLWPCFFTAVKNSKPPWSVSLFCRQLFLRHP
jgi:hypothetical protein